MVTFRHLCFGLVLAVFAGCSGGGKIPAPPPILKPDAPLLPKSVQVSLSQSFVIGTPAVQPLTILALDANNIAIGGPFASPIVINSSDPAHITFAVGLGGNFGASATLNSGADTVYVQYDGAAIPGTDTFGVTSSSFSPLLFAVPITTPSGTPSDVGSSKITNISVSAAGFQLNASGTSPIYVTAYDGSTIIAGSYPTPISVTLNNNCHYVLSLTGTASTSSCAANNAAVQVSAAGQTVYLTYDGAQNQTAQVSVTASATICIAINFPGNTQTACQASTQARPRGVFRRPRFTP